MSHHDWLRKHFVTFLTNLGVENAQVHLSLVSAHADKCQQYRNQWEPDIPFDHGVALYLLTYLKPYSNQVPKKDGWLQTAQWVKDQYATFQPHLPPAPCPKCRSSTWDNPCSQCKPRPKP